MPEAPRARGCVVWITGIQAAGKTTLARALEKALASQSVPCEVLDGDDVRQNLSPGLGYTPEARDENTRRLAWLASLLARHGVVAIVAAVSPLQRHRDRARASFSPFIEVFARCSLDEARRRDPKGLYARAQRGEIVDLVGVHQPYEAPQAAEVVCDTEHDPLDACVERLLAATLTARQP